MTTLSEKLARRLKFSGLLVAAGLLVQVASIYWAHPLAFVVFIVAGGSLVAAGAALYLYSIVSV